MLTPYLEMRALLRILHVVKARGRHPVYIETLRDLSQFLGCEPRDIMEWDDEYEVIPGLPGFASDAVREHFQARLAAHGYPPIETILNSLVGPRYLLTPLQERKILTWIHHWLNPFYFKLDYASLIQRITQDCDLSPDDEEAVRNFVFVFIPRTGKGVSEFVERARALLKKNFDVVLLEHSSPVPLSEQRAEPAIAFTRAFSPLHEVFIGSHFFGPSPYEVLAIRARLALMQAKDGCPEDRVEFERILGDAENTLNGLYEGNGTRHQQWVAASYQWQEIERQCQRYEFNFDAQVVCSQMIHDLLHGSTQARIADSTGEAHNSDLHRFISESERLGKRRI